MLDAEAQRTPLLLALTRWRATLAVYGNNPQVTVPTGRCFGTPPPCVGCGLPVDAREEYLVLWVGARRRPDVLAVAHERAGVGPGDDDWDRSCATVLRQRWVDELAAASAGLVQPGSDAGGQRWFVDGDALHGGTALEVLDTTGRWLRGRFEYEVTAGGLVPELRLGLAGWGAQEGAITLPAGVVARIAKG